MSNEDSLHENRPISHYKNQALSMIRIYNPLKEGLFQRWLGKFEDVAKVINVPDYQMVELFKKMVDNNVQKIVEDKFSSVNFSELSYTEIIYHYDRYFSFSDETNVYKKRLKRRNQYEKETIEQYANSLREIYNMCDYGSDGEEILCNQFIQGIRNEETRAYLNEFRGTSFDEIVAKAIAFERVNDISDYLQPTLSMINIYRKKEGLFHEWLNKFEYVADLYEVPDYKMIALFNKMIDKEVHRGVGKKFSSIKFCELSYEQIINYYLRFFSSSNKTDVHRSRFMCRKQYEKESIDKFAKNLDKLRNMCKDKSNLEEELRKKFIYGLLDKNIRKFLRKMSGLSFEELVVAAIIFENKIKLNKGNTKS